LPQGVCYSIAEECKQLRKNVHEHITVPAVGQVLNLLLATVVVQLLTYYASVKRSFDPDFPRNLSKTLIVD
jgi:glucosamine 6-phosphate synthetase-like amidotransferase/phosphosugar isomerase protein